MANWRKSEVTATEKCLESKIAWKCAVLQQSLLYRVTALAIGCTKMWNEDNVVCSVLAARALMDTIALLHHISQELKRLEEARNSNAIDDLANEQLFATRNEQTTADGYGHRARSVLTYVDKFDKK
jgi:hypothetical protein